MQIFKLNSSKIIFNLRKLFKKSRDVSRVEDSSCWKIHWNLGCKQRNCLPRRTPSPAGRAVCLLVLLLVVVMVIISFCCCLDFYFRKFKV